MQRWLARAIYRPTFAYNYLLGRILRIRDWWNPVGETLILGAMPLRRDVRELKSLGVTGVINMCEEYPGPKTEYAAAKIEQLWLPTVDFNHPKRQFVEDGADFLDRHEKAGGRVYVHCKAGRARSATIALWWLVKYHAMTPMEAQEMLQKARPHINPEVYLRPVIQDLYADLQRKVSDYGEVVEPVSDAS